MDLQVTGRKALVRGGCARTGRLTTDKILAGVIAGTIAGTIAEDVDFAPMAGLLCGPLSRFIVDQHRVTDGGHHSVLICPRNP